MSRAVLIVLLGALLVGCGGDKVVSPTGSIEGPLPKAAAGDAAAGKAVFADNGCGGCHAFEPAGTTGTIGPDLTEALKGKDAAFIEESVTDPNKEIASGYQGNVMPGTYGSQLDSQQLANLVAFLQSG